MATEYRNILKDWLQYIKVEGRVADVGGICWPIKGKTKTWDVSKYEIFDNEPSRKGVHTHHIVDLNEEWLDRWEKFDIVFCTETMQFLYNPVQAMKNMNRLLRDKGILYISFHLAHPPMKGNDCIRFTRNGVKQLLHHTGFLIEHIDEPLYGYYLVKAICQN